MKKADYLILGIIIGCVLMTCLRPSCSNSGQLTECKRDTIIDTIKFYQPFWIDSVVVRYVDAVLPVKEKTDTIRTTQYVHDSVMVEVPISQTHYKDSTYEAWVSGFQPSLDSIKLYQPTITNTLFIKEKPKRFNVGVTAGYGITKQGLSPYVGVGITYSFISF